MAGWDWAVHLPLNHSRFSWTAPASLASLEPSGWAGNHVSRRKTAFVPSASGSKPLLGRLFASCFFREFLRPQLEKINQLGFFFLPMGGNTTRANVESLFEQAVFLRHPNQPVSGNPTRAFRRRTRFLPLAGGLKAPRNPPAGSQIAKFLWAFSPRFQTLVSRRNFTNRSHWLD